MPPTFAAATITRSGLWAARNSSTSCCRVRSHSLRVAVIGGCSPCLARARNKALPTMPLCPVTKTEVSCCHAMGH